MNTPTVTRFPGVHRRTDSGIYQFGLRAPDDLRAHFPGGWAIRVSLKTADLKEANTKAKSLQAEWSARFEALRAGKPRPIDIPVLRRRLFEQWERAIARLDDTYSRVPGKDRETRAYGMQCQIDELRQCLSGGRLPEWLEDGAQKYGDATSPAKSFHSFRHLVASELRLAGATDAQADAITGHAGNGVGRQVYAATIRREAERLRGVIELLEFPTKLIPPSIHRKQ